MFGAPPGMERHIGVLNQYVVTKLDTRESIYYIFHTRGENATSVLIASLSAHMRKQCPDLPQREIDEMRVTPIVRTIYKAQQFDAQEFERAKQESITRFGSSSAVELGKAVGEAKSSCVLGYTKVNIDDAQ